ncbi:restriction endonuclease subunit S [Brachybacterium sp. UMB0905]|uniref:restriction endonuclease subunit S n=1 Tax=Brachybacterium sp. UMB0905 TaxID=2069310 RepID=UPI000C80B2DD|nr:restriction endonuclease subunit S [Brachybacterium sp. UMB0905]PMC74594.1 hypothetical protein CJ197_12910 [Brachybacterium sp. UMB0905]
MSGFPLVELRRVTTNLDHLRIPMNASERAEFPGEVPYWGANSIVDHVERALVSGPLTLIGEDGAPFFDPIRPVAFATDEPIWPNNHVHVLRPSKFADHRFLAYALNSIDYRPYIKGSTRDKLNQADLSAILVPHPELAVQRAIADYLDHETAEIDAFIADLATLLELSHERVHAQLSDSLSRFEAETRPLRRFLSATDQGFSPDADSSPAVADEAGVLKAGCTNFGIFRPEANKKLLPSTVLPDSSRVLDGDLIVTRASGSIHHVGSAAIAQNGGRTLYLSDKTYRLTPNAFASREYLVEVMQSTAYGDVKASKQHGARRRAVERMPRWA